MKQRVSGFCDKYKADGLSILILWGITAAFLMIFFKLYAVDMRVPIVYEGGDDFAYLVNAKLIQGTGWITDFSRMGMPFGSNSNDFTTTLLYNFDNLGIRFFMTLVNEIGLAVNLYYFSLFFMIGTISYAVMRCLAIKRIWSVLCSATYAFMPYIMMRKTIHLVLSAYEFVPIAVLLCFWIFEDENFFRWNKAFLKYKRNIIAILFALLIANNGIGYYAFFTCFFLCVAGASKAIKMKKVQHLLKSVSTSVIIVLLFMLNMLPNIIYLSQNGSVTGVRRSLGDAETYGLKIIQLLLPETGHIGIFQRAAKAYSSGVPLVNENASAYLGFLGIIGFFVLLVSLFVLNNKNNKRIKFLAELNISAILLGTIGGFGMVISLMGISLVRCYNRLSIFIAFFSVLAIGFILSKLKINKIICVLISVFVLFGIYEQVPANLLNYEANKLNYESDIKFVKQIENSLEAGDMVYQFPYHKYPEGGPVNKMYDYSLFRGFLYSDTIKWSYGSADNRETDLWQKQINQLPLDKMLDEVENKGFKGIYIDTTAYTQDSLKVLTDGIESKYKTQQTVSDNGNILYYAIYK